jgi:hypothetical protein
MGAGGIEVLERQSDSIRLEIVEWFVINFSD